MKRHLSIILGLLMGIGFSVSAHAETIDNIKVVPNGSTLFIQWDSLSDATMSNADGYALWWDEYKSNMANNRSDEVQHYLADSTNSLEVRAADFETNLPHYFRVCAYYKEGRDRYLTNCSKIRKWEIGNGGNVTTDELISANEIDVEESSMSGSGDPQEVFGVFGTKIYDTYIILSWSRPNLADSEFDGSIIEIATDQNFTDIIGTLNMKGEHIKARINGLEPSTTYYIRGSFKKGIRTFGTGATKIITTSALMSEAESARLDRLRSRGLINDNVSVEATLNLNGGVVIQSTTTSTNTTTSNPQNVAEIEARIKVLEAELSTLKARLQRLKGTSTSSSSSRSSTRGLSVRERLRLILGR